MSRSCSRAVALAALTAAACGSSSAGDAPLCTADFVRARVATESSSPDGWPPPPGDCVVKRAPCRSACAAPGCAVTGDVEVTCPEYELASRALRVAPAGASTFLLTSGEQYAHLLEIDAAGGGTELALPDPEKALFGQQMIADGDGALHVAAWEPGETADPMGGAAFHFLRGAGGGWRKELVHVNDDLYVQAPRAMEVDPGGAPHVLLGIGPDQQALARRATDGTWTVGPADAWPDFTFDGTGAEIELRQEPVGDRLIVQARRAGVALPFALPVGGASWAVTPPPTRPLGAGAPPFAVAAFASDALHVGWPDGDATSTVTLPDTAVAVDDSYVGRDRDCFGPAHFQKTGFNNVAFGIARTDDGAVWVAYLLTAFDMDYQLGAVCPSGLPTNCACGPKDIVDRSTDQLHVVRVPLDGAPPIEALNLPLERQKGGDLPTSEQLLQVRAHGNHLSIVARVQAGDGRPKLRLVTLESGGR